MKITKAKVATVTVGILLGYMLQNQIAKVPVVKELPKL